MSDIFNGRQPRVYVIQYNRQMHEQLQKAEKQRQGRPFPITIIPEHEFKDGQSHQGELEDRQEFIPYILPDAVVIEK